MKVYVHIPFCHSKCAYCDFYSLARPDYVGAYLEALRSEWKARRPAERADTLYFGGGTPSIIPPAELMDLADLIAPGELRELTVEANPEDVSREWVKMLVDRRPGIRVSMGVQSLSDEELRAIGRRHTSADALEALKILRSEGIENISADLIYGLPGQTLDSFISSLERLIEFRPEHLSCYLLSYEPGTLLTRRLGRGEIEEADDALVSRMYDSLCQITREAGYRHYEISNFALPGREAIHNSSYWDDSEYIGLGPGAHSYLKGIRGANRPDLRAYIASGGTGVYDEEDESADSRYNDLLLTRLRTDAGLPLSDVAEKFGSRYLDRLLADASRPLSDGDLTLAAGVLRIPEERWLTSNSILLPLIIA